MRKLIHQIVFFFFMFACCYFHSHRWVSILFTLLLAYSFSASLQHIQVQRDCMDGREQFRKTDGPCVFCALWWLLVGKEASTNSTTGVTQAWLQDTHAYTGLQCWLRWFIRKKTKFCHDRTFHLNPGHFNLGQCIKSAENDHYRQQEVLSLYPHAKS